MDFVQQEECESIQVHGGSYDFEDFQIIACKPKKCSVFFSLYHR